LPTVALAKVGMAALRDGDVVVTSLLMFLAIIIALLIPIGAEAQDLPYNDVPDGIWYEDEVKGFLDLGYLDKNQESFRAGDRALRSEFMKLVVELNGGILDEIPTDPSFSDVSPGDWFFSYLEEAAREGWTQGDGNCYALRRAPSGLAPASAKATAGRQDDSECFVRPRDPISRAEAAILIRRAFGKTLLKKAPAFADNPSGEWFTEAIQSAADHCILRGDDGTRTVRPHDFLNRAEMVVMLQRVDNGGKYPNCL
jgi:hypothetical protein